VRILDADDNEVPVGEIGEICLRGGFMTGYWGKPEKTAEALRGGWLHSGDAGVIDRGGYLTMRGRFAELIKVGDKTWFPRDVEEALCAHAGVREAAIIGLPDATLGQRPVGYVTTHSDGIDLVVLKAAITAAVPYDLAPLMLISLPAFPMTPTGKIAKAELRARALASG
jgi:acyl-CoA synthetase (AMP-forming)/AMP-acid ligase II